MHYEILGRVVYDLLRTESEDYAAFESLRICADNAFDGEGGARDSLELFMDILCNGSVTLLRLATNLSMFLQLTPFIFVAKLFYNLNRQQSMLFTYSKYRQIDRQIMTPQGYELRVKIKICYPQSSKMRLPNREINFKGRIFLFKKIFLLAMFYLFKAGIFSLQQFLLCHRYNIKVAMQKQSIKSKLSRRTRGLLYRAKKSLDKSKKSLANCRDLFVPIKWIIGDINILRIALQLCQVRFNESQYDFIYIDFINHIPPGSNFQLNFLNDVLEKTNQDDNPDVLIDDEFDQILQRFEQQENILDTIGIKNEDILNTDRIKWIFDAIKYKNQPMEKMVMERLMERDQAITVNQFKQKLNYGVQQMEKILKSKLLKGKRQILSTYINSHLTPDKQLLALAANCLYKKESYKDQHNPICSKSHTSFHIGVEGVSYFLFSRAEKDLPKKLNKALIKCISPQDVIQGQINDKYFLYAISIIVDKYPQLIFGLFTLFKNPSNIYVIRLFVDGKWCSKDIDTKFHINLDGDYCGARSQDQVIWPMLLQKAYAKVNKSYESIQTGTIEQGMTLLTGAPSIHFDLVNGDNFWERAQFQCNRGSVLTCWDRALIDTDRIELGLITDHFYSLLDVITLKQDNEGKNVIFFKLRDSQGNQSPWKGDWSINHNHNDFWTSQLRKQLGYSIDSMDGTFIMCQEDFYKYFAYVNVCRIHKQNINSQYNLQLKNGKFSAVSIIIKQKGNYYFTNYLQDRRINNDIYGRQIQSWMLLIKQSGGKFQKINSNLHLNFNTTIKSVEQLEQGEYIMILMVKWPLLKQPQMVKKWPQKNQKLNFCLASYGPNKARMKFCEFSLKYIQDEVYTNFQQVQKINFYQDKKFFIQVKLYPQFLLGLIVINNQSSEIFNLKISFQEDKDVIMDPPSNYLQVRPGDKIIIRLILKKIIDESSIIFDPKYQSKYLK